MMIKRPEKIDYPSFYETYIKLIQSADIISLLENQGDEFSAFVKEIDHSKGDFKYAEDKWSVKEVIGHIIEVERIMAYRALAISRGDSQSLPGMDENLYIKNSNYTNSRLTDLAAEFHHVRKANLYFFKSLTHEMINRQGVANGNEITVAALVYIIAGHLSHHLHILKERYLLSAN
jgi:hypothetical protein